MTVGQNIRALRKKKGLTQDALGQLCGLSGVAVCAYERGRTLPKRQIIERFAQALDATPSAITGESEPEPVGIRDPFHDGVLGALKALHGTLEARELTDGSGGSVRYYLTGPDRSVLLEKDVDAIARSARAAVLAQTEWMRKRQPALQEKLG